MTLHEAMEKLLWQIRRPMTTTEIANELNKNGCYHKKDGSIIQPYQIYGRTKNYNNIFNLNGSAVSLRELENSNVSIFINQAELIKTKHRDIIKSDVNLEKLMKEKNFRSAATIDSAVPDTSGLYCIRINDITALPNHFDKIIEERQHNIIYVGIATQSLNKRFLNQELRAKGHGTFFRSIGAVLGYRPARGSLKNKVNKKNYKFTLQDEIEIIKWINDNLIVNWIEFNGDFKEKEQKFIEQYLPLLNIDKNPSALAELSDLRALCVEIANS